MTKYSYINAQQKIKPHIMSLKGMRYMYRILVAGGDMRSAILANLLSRDGHMVSICGFDNFKDFDSEVIIADGANAASDSDIIILPLPISQDGIMLYTPLASENTRLAPIINSANGSAIITGGRVISTLMSEYGDIITDYSIRDDFAYLNAVPTAEGAVMMFMQKGQKTLFGARCLVTGFGKCAEILAHTLGALGAKVSIFARSAKDLSHASALGFEAHHLDTMKEHIGDYDAIFNTVPFAIFRNEHIDAINPECIFIDLASAPGGLADRERQDEINYTNYLGIPGKYSPHTAAEIIKKVIMTIMQERGKDAY